MDDEFWLEKWRTNQTGFHEGHPNAMLARHFAALDLAPGARVFVPLCGKTRDIAWLRAQDCEVVGCELSPVAIDQLFTGLGATPRASDAGALRRFAADGVRVYGGNIFELDRALLGPVDAIYDRAALVALPSVLRTRYTAHLIALTDAAPQLLVSLAYDQACADGPPFSVEPAEIEEHYAEHYRVSRLEEHDVEGGLRGALPLREAAWLLDHPDEAPGRHAA